MMVGYRRHIDDTIAAYIRNAEMIEFSGVTEANDGQICPRHRQHHCCLAQMAEMSESQLRQKQKLLNQ
jgi:hypothetical protein